MDSPRVTSRARGCGTERFASVGLHLCEFYATVAAYAGWIFRLESPQLIARDDKTVLTPLKQDHNAAGL